MFFCWPLRDFSSIRELKCTTIRPWRNFGELWETPFSKNQMWFKHSIKDNEGCETSACGSAAGGRACTLNPVSWFESRPSQPSPPSLRLQYFCTSLPGKDAAPTFLLVIRYKSLRGAKNAFKLPPLYLLEVRRMRIELRKRLRCSHHPFFPLSVQSAAPRE